MKKGILYTCAGLFIFFFVLISILFLNKNDMSASLLNSNINLSRDSFNVVLSNNADRLDEGKIVPSLTPKTVTATSATISNTIVSGINATFTGENEKVTYKFYAKNTGTSKAFLKGIVSGRLICTPGESTSFEETNKFCSGVTLTIKASKDSLLSTTNIDGSLININNHQLNDTEEIKVVLESPKNYSNKGQFNIIVPTISLMYYQED